MSQFDGIFDDLRRQADSAAQEPMQFPEAEGVGASEDQQVNATVANGKLTALRIDPRAMRRTNAELADQVIEAVNGALESYGTALTEAMQDQQTDFGALGNSLGEIQQQTNQAVAQYLDAMTEMLGRASGQRENLP